MLAVQGPNALERLATVLPGAAAVGRFRVGTVGGTATCTVAGTGYTGERASRSPCRPMRSDRCGGVVGAGIARRPRRRDTLRLEAGLPLHGHELGPGITPLQAGLGWVVGWDKPAFRGRRRSSSPSGAGVERHLVGIATEAAARRGPARCSSTGTVVGEVTSGNFSPVLGHGIALAFVPPGARPRATAVEIDVAARRSPARSCRPRSSAADDAAPATLAGAFGRPTSSQCGLLRPPPSFLRRGRLPGRLGAFFAGFRRGVAGRCAGLGGGRGRQSPRRRLLADDAGMRTPNRPPACSASWASGDSRRDRSLMIVEEGAEVGRQRHQHGRVERVGEAEPGATWSIGRPVARQLVGHLHGARDLREHRPDRFLEVVEQRLTRSAVSFRFAIVALKFSRPFTQLLGAPAQLIERADDGGDRAGDERDDVG